MSTVLKLKELGLSDKETMVYLALLKRGRTSPSRLSQITKINRATIYSTAKTLHSKGLIAEDVTGKSRFFAPLPPDHLNQLIERPRRDLEEKEKLVQETINELHQLTLEKEYPVPKIRFVQEGELEDFLFESTAKWEQSALGHDGTWWGFQDHSFVETYEKWIHWTWTTPLSKDPRYKARIITNAVKIERELKNIYTKEKRGMRTLPKENFTSTIWVVGDYVISVATQHHPFYLVETHDALLAHNMREMFKKMWPLAKDLV